MSVKGAAIATIISQIAMTIFIVIYSSRKYEELRFTKPDFQKAAIYVGTLNSAPSSDNVTITGNTIIGEGQNDIIAQNGIWTYTTGNLTIEDNTIRNLLYKKDGNDYGSTGIAVDGRFTADETVEADAYVQLLTENNTIENVDDPVYVAGETTEATT